MMPFRFWARWPRSHDRTLILGKVMCLCYTKNWILAGCSSPKLPTARKEMRCVLVSLNVAIWYINTWIWYCSATFSIFYFCFSVVADVLSEFLEVAVHLILYVREVYPIGIFQKRKKYNVPVQVGDLHEAENTAVLTAQADCGWQ